MNSTTVAIFGGLSSFLALTTALSCYYTVDQQERAVILRNGAVIGTAEPGLNFKAPWIDSVVHIPIRTETVVFKKVETYSKDQQPTDIELSVTYHIPPSQVADVYTTYGGEQKLLDTIITPKTLESLKNVFGTYDAVTAIQDRAKLNAAVQIAVQGNIKAPVVIDSVQLQDIAFSKAYENSVEARMLAQVEVQKLQQNFDREKIQAQITVTQAQAKADSEVAQARADATATELRGAAEAKAIKARGDALKDNPQLVQLTTAEKWDGKLPSTMLPTGAVPFISTGAQR